MMITYLDNRGGGDCGYLAFAIGLIEQIQKEVKENQTGLSQTFFNWNEHGLDDVELDEILAIKLSDLSNKDLPSAQPLLNKLQQSLRNINYEYPIRDYADAPDDSMLFQLFKQVVQNYQDSQFNHLDVASVHELISQKELNENSPDEDIHQVIREDMARADNSVILAAHAEVKVPGNTHWATEGDLSTIAKALNVQFRVDGHTSQFSPGPCVTLINKNNNHWTTRLESPLAVQTEGVICPISEDDQAKFKNYKQLIQATFLSKDWMQTSAHPAEVTRFEDETDDKFRDRQKQIHDDETLARKLQVEEVRDVSPEDVEQALSSFKPSR